MRLWPCRPPGDDYIAGYAASSMLKHKLMLNVPSLTAQNGVIIFLEGALNIPDRSNVMQMLAEIPGVSAVKIAETAARPMTQAPVADVPAQPAKQPAEQLVAVVDARSTLLPAGLLPSGHLFNPLLADPRWAHFSAAYRHFMNDNFDGRSIAAVSFGETIPVYRVMWDG